VRWQFGVGRARKDEGLLFVLAVEFREAQQGETVRT
jgi:hypothetical protein